LCGNLSGFFSAGDLAFDAAGTLYLTTTTNQLVKVDLATGSATLIGPLAFADVFGMGGRLGRLQTLSLLVPPDVRVGARLAGRVT
jgi:hypothetical protein